MATARPVWGIDLGRCALKAIKLRANPEGKVELLAADYVEHAKILSQPDAERQELISAALEKFLSRNDVSKDQVVVNVPGQHTLARFTKLPPVTQKRIPDIVRYEADQQIPFDMDEVIWDYQVFQQEGLPDLEVGIFAMKRELIREHLLYFEQAAIEPIGVQSGPLAVYNAAVFDGWMGKETTILLDIGAENTDLVIGTPYNLWTRTLPIGGNAFTEALAKSFKLSFAKAEALKRTASTNKYARQIFTALRPTFADLVQELQRSIGFYSSTHRDASVDKVVGAGNAFLLPGLQKYLQQNLGYNVDLPTSFNNSTVASTGAEPVLKEQFSSFAVAYGLALQGLELTKVTSNLLPTEIAKQVIWRKKRPAFAAAAAFLVLVGGLIWFRQIQDMRALAGSSAGNAPSTLDAARAASIIDSGPPSGDSDRVKAQTILAAGNALKKQLTEISGQGETERKEAERLIGLLRQKTVIPSIVKVIHESVPGHEQVGGADSADVADRRPRNLRKEAYIDELLMHFEPDLRDFNWTSSINVPPHLGDYGEKGKPLPGIRMTLRCRTPNKDGAAFIRDELVGAILKNGRRLKTGFYYDRVAVVSGSKVDIQRLNTGAVERGSGRGSTPRTATPKTPSTTPGSPTGTATPADHLDPLTLEPMDDDWEFEILLSVILSDYPGGDGDEENGG